MHKQDYAISTAQPNLFQSFSQQFHQTWSLPGAAKKVIPYSYLLFF